MAQLTLDQKRQITSRLGYKLMDREGTERRDLIGPDGRHRGIFRPSKAADVWIWNDAVFQYELYRKGDGSVHRRLPSSPNTRLLEPIWPEAGERHEVSPETLTQAYERLAAGRIL